MRPGAVPTGIFGQEELQLPDRKIPSWVVSLPWGVVTSLPNTFPMFRLTASGVQDRGRSFFLSVPYLFHQKALNCGGFEERNRWYRCYITSKNREKNIKEKEYIGNRRFICTICSKTLIYLCF